MVLTLKKVKGQKAFRMPLLPPVNRMKPVGTDEHLAGLFAGDGFLYFVNRRNVGSKNPKKAQIAKYNWQPRIIFTQNNRDRILHKIQNYLLDKHNVPCQIEENAGKNRGANLVISGWKNCWVVLRILRKYRIISPKLVQLDMMHKVFTAVHAKKTHNKLDGLLKIMDCKKYLLSKDYKHSIPIDIMEVDYFGFTKGQSKNAFKIERKEVMEEFKKLGKQQRDDLKNHRVQIPPELVAGYTAAEGYWSVGIYIPTKYAPNDPYKEPVILQTFVLTGHSSERFVLQNMAEAMGIQNPKILKSKKKKSCRLVVSDFHLLTSVLPQFFFNASFDFSETKHNQFKTFCEIRQKVLNGEHLTKKGFVSIVNMLYNTYYRQEHKSRKHSAEELLAWADTNWPDPTKACTVLNNLTTAEQDQFLEQFQLETEDLGVEKFESEGNF